MSRSLATFATFATAAVLGAACARGPKPCVYDTGCNPEDRCVEGLCAPRGDGGSGGGQGGCDGSACLASWASLEWTFPAQGARVGARDGGVWVEARLAAAPGRTADFPSSLAGQAEVGPEARAVVLSLRGGGLYAAQLAVAADGLEVPVALALEAYAGLDAGALAFLADGRPPVLSAALEPAPVRTDDGGLVTRDPALAPGVHAFRRDQTMDLAVWWTDPDVDAASVRVDVVGLLEDGGRAAPSSAGVAGAAGACRAPCGAAACRCFTVDLSRPTLEAARGELAVVATASDLARNQAPPLDAGSRWVSRFRWRRALGPGANFESAPALGADGALYLGHPGGVLALGPDGAVRWDAALGPVRASVAVASPDGGEEWVFYSTGALGVGALSGLDGGARGSCSGALTSQSLAPALATTTVSGEAALTAFALQAGFMASELVALRAGASALACGALPFVTPPPEWPSNTVAFDGGVLVGFGDGTVRSFGLDDAGLRAGLAPAVLAGPVRGLALDLVTDQGVVSGFGAGALLLASGAPGGALISNSREVGPAVVTASGLWLAGTNGAPGELVRFGPTGVTGTAPLRAPLLSSPVLGARGLVYLAAANGDVEARDAFDLGLRWRLALAEAVAASPTLDVARDGAGAKQCGLTGTLYVATSAGHVWALVVDSPGLDGAARWPKYQHDARNTGNARWPRADATCP